MDIYELKKREYFGKVFTETLNRWKKKNKKSQIDFYQEVGISKNTVTAWKQGERYPQPNQMAKICEVFSVDPSFFLPVLPFEQDRVANSITEERSQQLQRYANENGMNENFYSWVTRMPSFIRSFPFYGKGNDYFWNNPLLNNSEDQRFDLVKFQFEDDKGHRIMMTEEDIDFLTELEEIAEDEVKDRMNRVKTEVKLKRHKIEQERINHAIDLHTKHLKISREEVIQRLNEFDITKESQRIDDEAITMTVLQIAKEKGIKPQYTKEDIVAMFPPDNPEYIAMAEKANKQHGASQERINQANKDAERFRQKQIQKMIDSYRELGYLVEDNTGRKE